MKHGVLGIELLREALAGKRIGTRFEYHDEIPSTNARLLSLPSDDAIDGMVILTELQTAGRGRQGRSWHCPRGAGILCTVGLADPALAVQPGLLSLIVPVAICAGIEHATGVRCAIDWPNDIVHQGRKLAGVLIEAHRVDGNNGNASARYAIGFGINCLQHAGHFPEDIRERCTSLDMLCPNPINRTSVLAAILGELDMRFADPASWNAAAIRDSWRDYAMGIGRRVRVSHAGKNFDGNLVDIDPTAAIIVQLDTGGRRMFDATSASVQWAD